MLVKQNSLETSGCHVKLMVAVLPLLRLLLYSVLSGTQKIGVIVT